MPNALLTWGKAYTPMNAPSFATPADIPAPVVRADVGKHSASRTKVVVLGPNSAKK